MESESGEQDAGEVSFQKGSSIVFYGLENCHIRYRFNRGPKVTELPIILSLLQVGMHLRWLHRVIIYGVPRVSELF